MQNIKITLGGTSYDISPLPIKASREWRQKMQEPLDTITGSLTGAMTLKIEQVEDLLHVLRTASTTILNAPDILLELLLAYSPVLRADQERIEAEAFDDEIAQGLVAVLKVAFPLGRLTQWAGPVKRST